MEKKDEKMVIIAFFLLGLFVGMVMMYAFTHQDAGIVDPPEVVAENQEGEHSDEDHVHDDSHAHPHE